MSEPASDPVQEGKRIAVLYLSKRGWSQEWRRSLNRQLYAGFQREEFELKERQCDELENEAETYLSAEVERLRHDDSPFAREVLRTILQQLGQRADLGFFAKQIMGHIRNYLGPFQT